MSGNYNIGALGVVAPFKAKEGTITITDGASAHGDIKVPVLSAGLSKGDYVKLDGEMTVTKAGASDTAIIGIVYNTPKWTVEPKQNYTQAQAVSGDMLREVGIETIFKKILTVPAKASEGIAAGDYVTLKVAAEKSENATDVIALSAQDSNNKIVVGFI